MIDLVLTLQVAFHIETKDFSHGKTKVLFHATFKIDTVHSMSYMYREADSRVLQRSSQGQTWWHTPLILARRRQLYIVSETNKTSALHKGTHGQSRSSVARQLFLEKGCTKTHTWPRWVLSLVPDVGRCALSHPIGGSVTSQFDLIVWSAQRGRGSFRK